MAVSDLTNTTWVINASVSQLPNNYSSSGYINYHINNFTTIFKSITKVIQGGVTTEVAFHISGTNLSTLCYFYTSEAMTGYNAAIDSAGWYKRVNGTTASNLVLEKMTEPLMITITSGTKTTDADLIAWFESNAVQQVAPTPSTTNNIFFGTSTINKVYFGTSEVSKIYYGNTLIYEAGGDIPLLAPTISLYDSDAALKIESANDEETQYEIYIDDVLVGTYNKFYDFEASSGSLTKCFGRQYYTGEIVTPQTVNDTSITSLGNKLFAGAVASKITISEGVITASTTLFDENTTTINISFPSTITNLQALQSYQQATLNIGLSGYIEYGWTTALPTPANNSLFLATTSHTTINFYVKSSIVTFNNYSLSISTVGSKTINYYFEESANETITFGTNLLPIGSNKIKITNNIYTDNASIKDAMLTYADANTTINVYKRDGGSW